ncbi:hypothetical protein KEM54_002347 [Ascosphaera aggregata]|nr:hypothetical protein KEM54_002347 [Ascosphaera aggregata]
MPLLHAFPNHLGRQAARFCISAPRLNCNDATLISAREYHISYSQWGKHRTHKRMSQLGGSIVRDSLDDTLALHKGLNRIRKMYSPRLEERDERNDRISARLMGVEPPFDIGTTLEGGHHFMPLGRGNGDAAGPTRRQRVSPDRADKSRRAAKGSRNSGPNSMPPSIDIRNLPNPMQPRIRDPTAPDINWCRSDAQGKLTEQYPWLSYMECRSPSDGKIRLKDEILAYNEFMQITPAEKQIHRQLQELVTLKLLDSLDATVDHGASTAEESAKKQALPLQRLRLPHSDILITLRPFDPAKCSLDAERGPSPNRPEMRRLSSTLLKKVERILKSTEVFGDADGNSVFESVRLTTAGSLYVAARHIPTGLRVVITTLPKLMKRNNWVDEMYSGNVPSLAVLYTAFRNFLDQRNLFDAGDPNALPLAAWQTKDKAARGLDHYTLSTLLVAGFELTRRSTRRPSDIADQFLDVLDFLANVDIAKYCISVKPPLLIPVGDDNFKALKVSDNEVDRRSPTRDHRNPQFVEARYRILDPIDPRWDLGGSLSLSRVIKRAFKGWQDDISRRLEQCESKQTRSLSTTQYTAKNCLLGALGANYEPFELWRDNLLIQGTKVGSDLKSLRRETEARTE